VENPSLPPQTKPEPETDASVLLRFEAALSARQMRHAEASAQNHDIHRRIMLASLTRSGIDLVASFRDDPAGEHLRAAVESLETYIGHLEDMLEASHAARARLLAVAQVLAREHGVAAA